MRFGFVSFMIVCNVSEAVWAQFPHTPAGQQWPSQQESQYLSRADGTALGFDPMQTNPSLSNRTASVPTAISFRHFAHKPVKRALESFSQAIKLLRAKREGEALDRLADAIRIDPEFFEAYLQMGLLWIQNETPERALPHLERALDIDSSSQAAQALAAWALLQLGRDTEAEFALRRSMQLGPTFPIFEDLLAIVRERRSYSKQPTP